MDLHQKYPGLSDLKAKARRRIPHFVWEFFDSGTGSESTQRRNRTMLDQVLFNPAVLRGEVAVDLGCTLLGKTYPAPFGIAPVGMSGLVWPHAERVLARHAAAAGIPYCLSTVAAQAPEDLAPDIGDQGWFQLYPPRDPDIRKDLLARARAAGFHTLVLTLDVPIASRRERQTRGGLQQPPRLSPRLLSHVLRCPAWAIGMLSLGMPRMRTMDKYSEGLASKSPLPSNAHIGYLLRTSPDLEYFKILRAEWDGPLIAKGVMDVADVAILEAEGADAIWVSNHAGRQFDGSLASIEVLPRIRAATGLPIVFDSGVEGGLDIMRALALGADFVMLGRAWHYAVAALNVTGPSHFHDMLTKDLIANMGQIGAARIGDLPDRLVKNPSMQGPTAIA